MKDLKFLACSVVFVSVFFSCTDSGSEKNSSQSSANTVIISDTLSPGETYLRDCRFYYTSAKTMDSILLGQNEVVVQSANQAIKAFTDFAYYCASDTLSPVYLIKAAQVARAVNNITQAKTVLERCIEHYPSFKDRAAAIFLLAQLYDEAIYLNNEEEARVLYQKIIDEYPNSVWAVNAKAAIHFLGKSDEQMIREFKKKS